MGGPWAVGEGPLIGMDKGWTYVGLVRYLTKICPSHLYCDIGIFGVNVVVGQKLDILWIYTTLEIVQVLSTYRVSRRQMGKLLSQIFV